LGIVGREDYSLQRVVGGVFQRKLFPRSELTVYCAHFVSFFL